MLFCKLGKSAVETAVSLSAMYADKTLKNWLCINSMTDLKTINSHHKIQSAAKR
jgi:hypothetical protein